MSAHPDALLLARNISKSFGGVQALHDVSLDILRGEIHGLIGPNGAGKTSLFNTLTGLYEADQGHATLNGERILGRKPNEICQLGLARTFQNLRLFQNLSVLENVMIGRHVRTHTGVVGALLRTARAKREEQEIAERAQRLLAKTGLLKHANTLAKHLSYGDQRRLEIARALATDPVLLALDEPAAGMNATETESLKALLLQLRDEGLTLLLIEHDMHLVMQLCNRLTVLEYGRKIAEGSPHEVQNNPRVIAAYLGTAHEEVTS